MLKRQNKTIACTFELLSEVAVRGLFILVLQATFATSPHKLQLSGGVNVKMGMGGGVGWGLALYENFSSFINLNRLKKPEIPASPSCCLLSIKMDGQNIELHHSILCLSS